MTWAEVQNEYKNFGMMEKRKKETHESTERAAKKERTAQVQTANQMSE